MKKELLIPVGNYESLEYAIAGGADAVYAGLKKFNARGYATNFDESEMVKVIRLCHLYGVKIYVTMNTVIKDQEVEEFIESIRFLYHHGVDAVIMQDFGMISLVREMFPNLEIHASTQTNACNIEVISLFHEMGIKRVVLPREMSLAEIDKIDIPIEKEVFIHGALCMSYSGRCLMSSMIGSRSGNRGQCTGCCRLPYSLYNNQNEKIKEGYLLSTKELNTSSRIKDLLNSSITSFKVEGRMKTSSYVGFITSFYRKLIDGSPFDYEEELDKLKILFNRDFTTGHLFRDDIKNELSPNHLGLKIGQVVSLNKKRIKIKLCYPLYQEDGIRFQNAKVGFVANFIYDSRGRLISKADANQIIEVDNKINLTKKDAVYKTTSKYLLQSLSNLKAKKIPISFSVVAKINHPLSLEVTDFENTVVEEGKVVEEAKTSPTSKEDIIRQLGKLGNTPFVLEHIDVKMDSNIFISIQLLNELRRKAVAELVQLREKFSLSYIENKVNFLKLNTYPQSEMSIEVKTEEQLKVALATDVTRIYVPKDLYQKYHKLERCFCIESEDEFPCLHQTYKKPQKGDISDYTFNVTNIYTVYYLLKLGYKKVTLSVELSNEEIIHLFTRFQEVFHFIPSLEVVVYGRVVVMDILGNVLNIEKSLFSYFLKDHQMRLFPVAYQNGHTYIYNYETRDYFSFELLRLPISLRLIFSTEEKEEIKHLVNRLK